MKLCRVCEKVSNENSLLTEVTTCKECFLRIEQERFSLSYAERPVAIPLPRDGECEFEQDCHKPIWARRFCRSHYERVAKLNYGRVKPKKVKSESDRDSLAAEATDLWEFIVSDLKKKGHHSVRQL